MNLALSVQSTQVAQTTINGVLQTFVVWPTKDPCPGYMVRMRPRSWLSYFQY